MPTNDKLEPENSSIPEDLQMSAEAILNESPSSLPKGLSKVDIARFDRDGYLLVKNLYSPKLCDEMASIIQTSLDPAIAPVEYEAELHYPGSPPTRHSPGGDTSRRLLHAYARDEVFRNWATNPSVVESVRSLLGGGAIQLSQNHHNCIMTKYPGYGSSTGWHQDMRYWSFDRPELVTAWLALGDEYRENGCLTVVPGSHRMNLDRGRFDAALFFRDDLEENRDLIKTAKEMIMRKGDALYFHCRLIHSAGRNYSNSIKYSVVFTYHSKENRPIAETRSAKHSEIDLPAKVVP